MVELNRRAEIEARSAELNAKAKLAAQQQLDAVGALLKRPDISEIAPILKAFVDAARIETTLLWLTSITETKGDIVAAWDLVDGKTTEKRELNLSFGDQSSSSSSEV